MANTNENYLENFYGLKSQKSTLSTTEKSKNKSKYIANLVLNGLRISMISKLLRMTPNQVCNYIRLARHYDFLPSKETFNTRIYCSTIIYYKIQFLRKLGFTIRDCGIALGITNQSVLNYLKRTDIPDIGDNIGIIFQVTQSITQLNLEKEDLILLKSFVVDNEYILKYRKLMDLSSSEPEEFIVINVEDIKDKLRIVAGYPMYYVLSQNNNLMACHP